MDASPYRGWRHYMVSVGGLFLNLPFQNPRRNATTSCPEFPGPGQLSLSPSQHLRPFMLHNGCWGCCTCNTPSERHQIDFAQCPIELCQIGSRLEPWATIPPFPHQGSSLDGPTQPRVRTFKLSRTDSSNVIEGGAPWSEQPILCVTMTLG